MPVIKNARFQQRRNTSEYWRMNPTFVPLDGEVIVYTDYQIVNGRNVPAIKIGDGKTAIVSLPFVSGNGGGSEALVEHMNDSTAHVTAAERMFWNSKLNYRFEGETLIFTTD